MIVLTASVALVIGFIPKSDCTYSKLKRKPLGLKKAICFQRMSKKLK